jgi:multicomponent Na+:H+ antiporter subunit D
MTGPTTALVVCSLAVAAAAGPLYSLSERAAHDLLDRDGYVERVLRP